ncbi:fasciclin domain-containing protein [Subsaxibacter sp. CAU 1640]|uniref:fasciclin domain-containing protein n=1 Tax=Subsaxibacter sp. CAU 1640 TaxID=2933271 RepID=UPI0020033926|nr:fasciclin domain-containing protein [Subsaxibacter sp. CAU 1640]MCK7591673.1 fasciclin domain-containing protein [Subsaxibacter sp. CAU 1640]
MKIISNLAKFIPILFLVMTFSSCSNDDDNSTPQPQELNIVETAMATSSLSNLVAALQVADGNLVDVLNGSGPFTVLAPTNDAFETFLSDNGFNSLSEVPTNVLSQILLNHVISGDISSSDLMGMGSGYTTTNATGAGGNPMSLYFNTSNGVRFNGVSSVTTADVMASNGTIHIVDAVIGLPNIVTHAVANPNLSSLVGALTSGGNTTFTDLLSSSSTQFTVFAPNNSAFSAYTNPNGYDINTVLANHVIVGATATSDGLENSYVSTAATNSDGDAISLYVNTDDGVVLNGMSNVMTADIIASNGVIHVVDEVIDLPTIVTFATTNPALTNLVAALQSADSQSPSPDLIGTLSGNGPFTVFAPTDAAFGDLLLELDPSGNTSLGDVPPATVQDILLYHVVSGNVRSTDLMTGPVPTLGGSINLDATNLTLTDPNGRVSNIITSLVDIQAINGVVHAIDKVILPQQ